MNNQQLVEIRYLLNDINEHLKQENKYIKAYAENDIIRVVIYNKDEIVVVLNMEAKTFPSYLASVEKTLKYRLNQ